jgi:hypothetical protein
MGSAKRTRTHRRVALRLEARLAAIRDYAAALRPELGVFAGAVPDAVGARATPLMSPARASRGRVKR